MRPSEVTPPPAATPRSAPQGDRNLHPQPRRRAGLIGALALGTLAGGALGGPLGLTGVARAQAPGGALGVLEQPIISGRRATAGELFATVAITDADGAESSCTGTLIAPRVVVTAAHCVVEQDEETDAVLGVFAPDELGVVAGVVDVADARRVVAVRRVVVHPGYPNEGDSSHPSGAGRYDDVALLLLADAVTEVAVATIPTPDEATRGLTRGAELTLTGYGATGADRDDGGILHIAESRFDVLIDAEIVVGGAGQPDTCPGDSGGPVYRQTAAALWLVGITSRAVETSSANCGEGGVYAFAPAYRGWIAEASEGLFTGDVSPGPSPRPEPDPDDEFEEDCEVFECDEDDEFDDEGFDEDDDYDDEGCAASGASAPAGPGLAAGLLALGLGWARRRRRLSAAGWPERRRLA